MNMVWQLKKKIHSYGQPELVGHVPLLNSKVISMFLRFPNTSAQAEVIGDRIKRGGGYGLEIPVSYHFYGHENGINWLKNKPEAIRKNLKKNIKHCRK